MSEDLHHFRSRAVRALVLLHEQQLHDFAEVWKQSNEAGVQLPETDDEHYCSLEHLLGHVLQSARAYLRRMLIHLGRPAPDLAPVSALNTIGADLDGDVTYLLERWRTLLADVQDSETEPEVYTPGMHYWIDAMLEHAVMHPLRHSFQLRELLRA